MSIIVQPCDWHEHDVNNKYVIDMYGRAVDGAVVLVRITDFKPYFYSGTKPSGGVSSQVEKYDMMAGFKELKPIKVWKVETETKAAFHTVQRGLPRLYESNFPTFLKFFHHQHINPASLVECKNSMRIKIPINEDTEEELYKVERMYQCSYKNVAPSTSTQQIPLKVSCYDLEMYSTTGKFPQASIDPIIQMGISTRWSNDLMTPIERRVFVFGSVSKSDEENTEFIGCRSERQMIQCFLDYVAELNPDIICGYNTFGFDDGYIEDRCNKLGIGFSLNRCPALKRKNGDQWEDIISTGKQFELASGKYDLRILSMTGRLSVDLLLNMRREHSLESFKLDSVASVFLKNVVKSYSNGVVSTKSTRGLNVNNYIRFDIVGNTSEPYREGHKFLVKEVGPTSFKIETTEELFTELSQKEKTQLEWTFTKDDVEPHALFKLHEGSADDRARIARYCIQDCDLVLTLMSRLDTIVNARGMSDVCKVPLQFVLIRGQGIKIYSAVLYYASQRNQIVETAEYSHDDSGYEGAVVISPEIGMYLNQPISVLDFNSLYPTNMISYNLSPDTLVAERRLDTEGKTLARSGLSLEDIERLEEKGYEFESISYDIKDEKEVVTGKTSCTFVQPKKDEPLTIGILPQTLSILLQKRKEYKNKMEDESYDEAQRAVFNGLQLAYKVVANSVYGQTGSSTSPIRKKCVAACTTSAGRTQLMKAKEIVETEFAAKVIYGDTDSIFIKFPTTSLEESIQLGMKAGKRITELCRKPYKIAYEKTLYPFILFCRKRYVGMKYEEDPNPAKAKRMSMGIVLKRRDNAPIVKDVFGGALDILLEEKDVKKAQQFTLKLLSSVLKNELPLEKYIVSKSLRDDYKVPEQIAHRVLADRMAARDPGTAPKVGDRIPYIYVAENKHHAKQGDKIEHVDYVRQKKLSPDVELYITNQIQNPVAQLFALCIEELDGYIPPRISYKTIYQEALEKYKGDVEEATLYTLKQKEKQLNSLLFLKYPPFEKLVKASIRGPMDKFLKRKD
jgi:DNA polymerase elongation subunit (family B)